VESKHPNNPPIFEGIELHYGDIIYCANGKKMQVSSLTFDDFKIQEYGTYGETIRVNYKGELARLKILGRLFSRKENPDVV